MEKDYVERDVSWMYFNRRILLEAEKEEVPLLERLGFLGIYSNNLDEFFRVRVATLNRIIEYEDKGIKREQQTAVDKAGDWHDTRANGDGNAERHQPPKGAFHAVDRQFFILGKFAKFPAVPQIDADHV